MTTIYTTLALLLLAVPARAYDLTALSLEELMDIEVFSAARWEQRLFETAAAIEVITGEEIRRAGVSRLPEALRLAVGVHAWHIDASKWGVTVRGFANRFANKLLVLVDGRIIYNPLFSGVFWEDQDLLLDDIERIEIIRGPGGTLWGANAVNGVINIITRSADQTQGTTAWGRFGPEERGFAALRYGGRRGTSHFRVWGKAFRRDALDGGSRAPSSDPWHMLRGGFRLDGRAGDTTWMLGGGHHNGEISQRMQEGYSLTPPYQSQFDFTTDLAGAHLLGRLEHSFPSGAQFRLNGHWNWVEHRDHFISGMLHTFGLDLQHRSVLAPLHTLVWGGEFRTTWDDIERTERFHMDPASRTTRLFSGFAQDELRLFAQRLRLVLGAKVEHNSFTGGELLPNFRFAWSDRDHYTFWGAVSRAVRLPTRGEAEGHHLENVLVLDEEPEPSLVVIRLVGNPDMKAEKLIASELGFRLRPAAWLTFDLATFYHQYDDLFNGEIISSGSEPDAVPPQFLFLGTAENKLSGRAYGAELGIEAALRPWWRLRGGWAYLHLDMELDPGSLDAGTLEFVGDNPEHRAVLRSLADLSKEIELDAALFYTGRMPDGRADRHLSLDMRLGWHPISALSLSLVGQHLLGDGRMGLDPEFTDTFPTRTQRSLFLSLRWNLRR